MKDPNPYSPPADVDASAVESWRSSRLPPRLLIPTKRALQWFGLYQFLFPIVLGAFADGWSIDVFALLILSTGFQMNRSTFRGFPKTVFLCGLYVLFYVASFIYLFRAGIGQWFAQATVWAALSSVLWTISFVAACYCIVMMLKCYRYHRNDRPTDEWRSESDGDPIV